MPKWLIFVAVVISVAVPAAEDDGVAELCRHPLTDQHGDQTTISDLEGPLVITVVTAKRLRNVRPWARFLHEHYPELPAIRIADIPADSPAGFDDVAAKLRQRVPGDVSVLIDMERSWAVSLSLDTSRPNILLIGSNGNLAASFRGRHTPELELEVASAIDSLGTAG